MNEKKETGKDVAVAAILIVEDHEALRKSLKDWLGAIFQNCRFLQAESGEEAMELAFAKEPDIILMDIGLPGINGIEATRRIKTVLPRTNIVMFSVYESSHYMAEATKVGAAAYIIEREMGRKLVNSIEEILAFSDKSTVVMKMVTIR